MKFVYNDGGRKEAGYKGHTGDCVCRAIAIVAQLPYQQVYDRLAAGNKTQRKTKKTGGRNTGKESAAYGVHMKRKWFKDYMQELGFFWRSTMSIGTGCQVHLTENELPKGRLFVRLSKHATAVIDGVINDTYDCSREETRCVYGYYYKPDADILAYTAEAFERFASTLNNLKD